MKPTKNQIFFAVICGCILLFWFNRFEYSQIGGVPIRTSRITGKSEVFNVQTWTWVTTDPSPIENKDDGFEVLSESELAAIQVDAEASLSGATSTTSRLRLKVYNGTVRKIVGLNVRVTFDDGRSSRELIAVCSVAPRAVGFVEIESGTTLAKSEWHCKLINAFVKATE